MPIKIEKDTLSAEFTGGTVASGRRPRPDGDVLLDAMILAESLPDISEEQLPQIYKWIKQYDHRS